MFWEYKWDILQNTTFSVLVVYRNRSDHNSDLKNAVLIQRVSALIYLFSSKKIIVDTLRDKRKKVTVTETKAMKTGMRSAKLSI